ncbi:minor capsid protein [Sutcliffiella halmapala]|uniref:minor capsid protein n=1 Tax=Sutcliffiella halmapala TaxID=79882 RepID=UPI000994EDE1|nr:minor capsid protein [Sutcliffiella halmapala]
MSVKVKVDLSKVAPTVATATVAAQPIIDQQVLNDSNFYAPEDTTELKNSAVRSSLIGKGRIIWKTPYARRWYYSSPIRGFSKDKNPNAQAAWFHKAQAVHGKEWEQVAQKAVKAGL